MVASRYAAVPFGAVYSTQCVLRSVFHAVTAGSVHTEMAGSVHTDWKLGDNPDPIYLC